MENRKECLKAGLDPKKVGSIARRLERLCREADIIGISVFCGSSNTLRFNDGEKGGLIVASFFAPNADGGAGDNVEDSEGYLRGEF